MSAAVTQAERHTMLQSAPEGLGDHVVAVHRRGGKGVGAPHFVYGIVRRDTTTPEGRLVALGRTSSEAIAKASPPSAAESERRYGAALAAGNWGSGGKAQLQRGGRRAAVTRERRRAAEAELAANVADYRRACVGAGVEAPKLV
jgi:hypothetical protein